MSASETFTTIRSAFNDVASESKSNQAILQALKSANDSLVLLFHAWAVKSGFRLISVDGEKADDNCKDFV